VASPRARLAAVARTTDRTYPPSEHVELQIYGTGWPSDEGVAACRHFHQSPWEMRLDIALASRTRVSVGSVDALSISNGPTCCGPTIAPRSTLKWYAVCAAATETSHG